LPRQGTQVSVACASTTNPGGGFTVHSDNPGTPGFNPAAQGKFDHYAEELLGFVDKHFSPPVGTDRIASDRTRSPGLHAKTVRARQKAELGVVAYVSLPTQPMNSTDVTGQQAPSSMTAMGNTDLDPSLLSNAPITPEATVQPDHCVFCRPC
jgi:hypothetical protein